VRQFRRAWIVQEIGTEAPATMFWGEAQIDWQILHSVSEQLTEYHHMRAQFEVKTSEIKYVFQRFIEPERTNRHANRFSFIYELHRARHLRVTDPRDHVFAFLGHYSIRNCNNDKLRALQANYRNAVEETYTDLAVKALTGDSDSLITLGSIQHDSLPSSDALLAQMPGKDPPPTGLSMPSWVPDWRTFQSYILSEPTSSHQACGSKAPQLQVDPSSPILSIHGVKVDSVEVCSDALKPKEFHINDQERVLAIERLWSEICEKKEFNLGDKYPNGETCFFAYMQTLSSGCNAISWIDGLPYNEVPKEKWLAYGAAYVIKAAEKSPIVVSPEIHDLVTEEDSDRWSRAANGASSNRKFARTTEGYYVLGPRVMETGDVISVLFGGKVPFCLRPWGSHYLLVGECYVHGFMNGESVDMLERGRISEEVFKVI
jgi:hypothetical protein